LRFRFLVDEPGVGSLNMALDEVLLNSAGEPGGGATVRIYGFDPPTVSFGYRQALSEVVNVAACREAGVGWVRRPTGGRALLHQHEVTYSVSSPVEGPFQGLGVRALYDSVSLAIRRALTALGVSLDPPQSSVRAMEPPIHGPCLALPGPHEITAGGRKVVASSQRRSRRAFLQHGSILSRVDPLLWSRVAPPGRPGASLHAVGLDELMSAPVPRQALVSSLLRSFEELFESRASADGLTRREADLLPELQRKYRA
jgi:lipoate-protein ligase A